MKLLRNCLTLIFNIDLVSMIAAVAVDNLASVACEYKRIRVAQTTISALGQEMLHLLNANGFSPA
jgi:hypothetical protein